MAANEQIIDLAYERLAGAIPEGTTATVVLPGGEYKEITVNGKPYKGDWKFRPGVYNINCIK